MNVLDRLDGDDLAVAIDPIATPTAIRSVLASRSEVHDLARAIREGGVSGPDVREWVAARLRDLRPGMRFPHEPAFCAMAVALERFPGGVAAEFLSGLASLKIQEIPLSIRVAAECVRVRRQDIASNTPEVNGHDDLARNIQALSLVATRQANTASVLHESILEVRPYAIAQKWVPLMIALNVIGLFTNGALLLAILNTLLKR